MSPFQQLDNSFLRVINLIGQITFWPVQENIVEGEKWMTFLTYQSTRCDLRYIMCLVWMTVQVWRDESQGGLGLSAVVSVAYVSSSPRIVTAGELYSTSFHFFHN